MKKNFTPSVAFKSVLAFAVCLLSVITTSAFVSNIAAKPVKEKNVVYESLQVTTTNKSVQLNWETVPEFNNSHFEVERSVDMVEFKTVAVVLDGFSTESNGKRYAFKENVLSFKNVQVIYYRLKQVDALGNFSYGEVIKVQVENIK